MPLSTYVHESPIRVRYAETDAAGIAHHSSFIPWFETGRVEWMRSRGASYAELESDGYTLPVVELSIRYVAPVRFDDQLTVRTALSDVRSRTVAFVYEIVTQEPHPRQVANGRTKHVCVRGGSVARLPDVLRRIVGDSE
jgi:acyl-CoA thioester hydrolase